MSVPLADLERAIDAAREQTRHDMREQSFFQYPFELQIEERHFERTAKELSARLSTGDFTPSAAPTIDVPKPSWHTRPGLIIKHRDLLVYHALTRLAAQHILPQLRWSEPFRHSHHFDDHFGASLLKPNQPGWASFTRETIATLGNGYTHTVFTDISGFYENIDLQHLSQDLRSLGVPTDVASLLSRLLNKWAEPRHKGIPQGCSASDVLAEFYLDPVDKTLTGEGIVFHRYSDDIRLFARSEIQARRSLHRLTRLLRERGLNLQTAKTEILLNTEARERLLQIAKRVEAQHKSVAEELRMLGDMGYEVTEDLKRIENATTERPTPEALLGILESIQIGEMPFDKSLVRYLLTRLSKNGLFEASAYAAQAILAEHPEETATAIRYLRSFPKQLSPELIETIVDHLVSVNCIYDYQVYQIVRWFCEDLITSDRLAANLRSRQMPPWLRHWAITYRAMAARNQPNTNEYANLMREYTDADRAERATILVSLHFAPVDFKKSNWARCKGEDAALDEAILWAGEAKSYHGLFGG